MKIDLEPSRDHFANDGGIVQFGHGDGSEPDAVWPRAQPSPFMLSDGGHASDRFALPVPPGDSTSNGPAFRVFDLAVAVGAIVLLAPLLLLLAVLVRVTTGGPVLFKHPRIGLGGQEFGCLKFRTMVPDADALIPTLLAQSEDFRAEWQSAQKLFSDPRITPVGRTLRRYSLDELPQLFNVLKGEMSIVGPRPIVRDEISRYGPAFAAYASVKPGLTGLWQVSGRNAVSYQERVRLDAEYARSKSLRMDFEICLRTIPVVIFAQGH